MTSGRLSNTENLPLFGAALVAMYAIYAALTRLPRRLARWVRGVFTAPLHKAPRGHAEQHERVPSPVFRSAFADRAGHETYTFGPKDLSGVHAALCACGRLAGHNGWCDPVPAPPLAPLPERPRPGTTCDQPDLGPAGVADVPVTDAGPGTRIPQIDMLVAEVKQMAGLSKPEVTEVAKSVGNSPEREETAGAPGPDHGSPEVGVDPAASPTGLVAAGNDPGGSLPSPRLLPQIADKLNGHTSTGDALDSMLQRALSPELLARLDAQKEASDG